jgi:hypothetical protein
MRRCPVPLNVSMRGGTCRIKERAEALPQLRCIEVNGDWEAFIAFVHDKTMKQAQHVRGCYEDEIVEHDKP